MPEETFDGKAPTFVIIQNSYFGRYIHHCCCIFPSKGRSMRFAKAVSIAVIVPLATSYYINGRYTLHINSHYVLHMVATSYTVRQSYDYESQGNAF
jgi:hypothetical protein